MHVLHLGYVKGGDECGMNICRFGKNVKSAAEDARQHQTHNAHLVLVTPLSTKFYGPRAPPPPVIVNWTSKPSIPNATLARG